MSIIGGSLIGTLTTRLPPAGSSVVGGSLVGGLGQPLPYATPVYAPKGAGSMVLPAGPGPYTAAVPPAATAAAPQSQGVAATASRDPATVQIPCLTAGLPTPDAIAQQKEQYARSLEEQLKQGVELLGQTHKQKTDHLHATANQSKHQYNLMLDQQVKQQEMLLSQQYNQQLMMLQQAAQQQRAELEQQAATLTLEWQQRQTQEEFLKEQIGIQQRYAQVQKELAVAMEKVGGVQGGSHLLPVGAALPAAGGSHLLPVGVATAPPVITGLVQLPASTSLSSSQGASGTPVATARLQYIPPPAFAAASGGASAAGSMAVPPGSAGYAPPVVMGGTLRGSTSTSGSQGRSWSYAPTPSRTVIYGGSSQLPVGSGMFPVGTLSIQAPSVASSMCLPVGSPPSGGPLVYALPPTTLTADPVTIAAPAPGGPAAYAQAVAQAVATDGAGIHCMPAGGLGSPGGLEGLSTGDGGSTRRTLPARGG